MTPTCFEVVHVDSGSQQPWVVMRLHLVVHECAGFDLHLVLQK